MDTTWSVLADLQMRLIESRKTRAENDTRIAQLASAKEELKEKRSANRDLLQPGFRSVQLQLLDADIAKVTVARDEALARQEELIRDLKSVREITRVVRLDIVRLDASILKVQEESASVKLNIDKMAAERRETLKSTEAMRPKLDSQRAKMVRLSLEVSQEKSRCDQMKKRNVQLDGERVQLERQTKTIQIKMARLHRDVQEIRCKVNEAHQTRRKALAQCRIQERELKRTNVIISRMKKK